MLPHPRVNQQLISIAQVTPSEISRSDRSYPGFLHWNIAEEVRNTDFLRARASTTQLQGDGWLDLECAAIPTKIRKNVYKLNKTHSQGTDKTYKNHHSATSMNICMTCLTDSEVVFFCWCCFLNKESLSK